METYAWIIYLIGSLLMIVLYVVLTFLYFKKYPFEYTYINLIAQIIFGIILSLTSWFSLIGIIIIAFCELLNKIADLIFDLLFWNKQIKK